jgi:hypothetical protein
MQHRKVYTNNQIFTTSAQEVCEIDLRCSPPPRTIYGLSVIGIILSAACCLLYPSVFANKGGVVP